MSSPPLRYFTLDIRSRIVLCYALLSSSINSALVLPHTKVLAKILDYKYVFVHIQYRDNIILGRHGPMRVPGVYIKAIIGLLILSIFSGAIISCSQAGSTSFIENLVSELPAVKKGESTQIECTTAARYGSELTYEWTATGGSILGTGSTVNWTAPDIYGTYSVAVTVTDERGRESSKQLSINVTESG